MKTQKWVTGASVVTAGALLILKSCRTIPKGAKAVTPFDSEKYLGKWYEVARLDYVFEKNLDHTTAEYSMRKDGNIKVVNKGHNYKTGKNKEATGVAKFLESPDIAKLKVSFFGPFYAGYNVIAIDNDYKYALVAGKNLKYLWLLSRTPTMPEEVKAKYLKKAAALGYKVDDLNWVKQD